MIFKCKMCGMTLEHTEHEGMASCTSCGTLQTISETTEENLALQFAKADEMRRARQFEKAQGIYELLLEEMPEDAEANWGMALSTSGVTYVKDPISRKFYPNVYLPQQESFFENENLKKAKAAASEEQKKLFDEEAKKIEEARVQILQLRAQQKEAEERRAKIRRRNWGIFKALVVCIALYVGYLLVNEYVIVPNMRYKQAEKYENEGDLMMALEVYRSLGDFRDSQPRAREILNRINYAAAEDYAAAGRYDKASECFEALGDYLDSAQKATDNLYLAGIQWTETRDGQQAYEAFEKLGDYQDSAERKAELESQYAEAVKMEEAGKIDEAVAIYRRLGNLQDSMARFTRLCSENPELIEVYDRLYFGTYEQDASMTNGKEAIEWMVLDRNGDDVMLLSRYGLETHSMTDKYEPTTWETSAVRPWLNTEFMDSAFSAEEKAKILLTEVENVKQTLYYTSTDDPTQDYLFFLSVMEADRYLPEREHKAMRATDYALNKGAYFNEYDGNSNWWLRTWGANDFATAYVFTEGIVFKNGYENSCNRYCIRPAMWVSLQ